MKTESYKWWEQVQSNLHKNFDNVRLSAEHILWLSENFPPAILKQADVIKSVCGLCNGEKWITEDRLSKPCPACGCTGIKQTVL